MKLPIALLLVVTVVLGCEKGPKATSEPAKSDAAPAKPPPPPPPPPPLVGEDTLREVNAVNQKIKDSVPITPADTEDQRADETTADYQQRIRTANRAAAKFNNEWRKCFVGRSDMGYMPASDMPLSKFVRESKIAFKWECSVFDIKRGPNGGDQVLCSTETATDWSYAVLGYLPKRHGLKKGSVIQFERLNTCMPAEGSALKIKLLNMDDNNLKFSYVAPKFTGDPAAVTAGKSLFSSNCAPCHGASGEGVVGPNLTDIYWLHGSSVADISAGVRSGYPDKGCPPFGEVLGEEKTVQVATFVTSLRNSNVKGKAPQGDAAP